jgi:hypothetical protein
MKGLFLLLCFFALAGSVQAQPAAQDTVSGPALLEQLQKEDKDYFIQDIWDFDLEWEDSLKAVLDSVGLDSLRDQIDRAKPWFSKEFSYNKHTLSYNRVEGFVPGVSGDFKFGRTQRMIVHGEGAYAFASKKVRYDTHVRWRIGDVGFQVGYADQVVPFGNNRVHGNSVRAFVGGSDDQDYLRSTGGRAGFGLSGNKWSLSSAYRARKERSVGANTEFALFGKMRDPNPEIDEGVDRQVYVTGHLGSYSRDRIRLEATHRVSGGALGGDFIYNRADMDLRVRQYVIASHEVTLRARGTAASSNAPSQRKADMGGIDLVRGFRRGTRVGDQSAAGRLEYFIPYDVFRRAKVPILKGAGLQLVPWADAGRTWNGDNDTWLTSAGLGVQIFLAPFRYFSYLRLDVAVPMGPDRPDDARVFIRFAERNF